MKSSIRALPVLFVIAAITTGCGGGGGSDDVPPPPPRPASATPLVITAAVAADIAALAPGIGDSMLAVAQFAVDSTRRFTLPGEASTATSTCPNGGLLTVTLSDRDADGVASAGDRISIEARDCAVPVVTDIVTGTVHIDLGVPTGLPAGSLRAAVGFADGLRFGSSPDVAVRLLGSLQLDWSSTALQTALHVTASAADDLRVVASSTGPGAASLTESIRQPDLTKTLKYDEARAVVSMSFRYESEALKGSITVVTPEPLRAYLNTYPEAGRVEVMGSAGSKIVVTPNFVNDSQQFRYTFDNNGDGSADASGSVFWSESLNGYLWWGGTTALNGWSAGAFGTRGFATTDFFATPSFDWKTATTSSMRLQFSRPLASTTPALFFRFTDQGSPGSYGMPNVDVAATAEMHGALVIVRPTAALRHARSYTLQMSLDGADWTNAVTVQDALGNSLSGYAWNGMSVTTPDNLRALAIVQEGLLANASQQVLLGAQTSVSTSRPIVGYQWSQVSGTPLRFSDAGAAQTAVSWGATAPTGVERAVVRLTVTDAAGDMDMADVTVLSADLSAASRVLYFRSAAGDYIGKGATTLFVDTQAQFVQTLDAGYMRASVITPNYADWWYLDLATADGAPLSVGAYENAIRAAFRGNQNGIDFGGNGSGCNQTAGRFDVLEIETDGTGAITRLAVDFEQHCEAATAPALLGSYRVNSSVPIRR